MTASNVAARVLLGVMTSPFNPRLRNQWREWRVAFNRTGHGVDVRFVLGNEIYIPTGGHGRRKQALQQEARVPFLLKDEVDKYQDLLFVDGREKLPHVGKVTEKSAAWWLSATHQNPEYDFYCKADDDTLVHVDRLYDVLGEIQRVHGKNAAVYMGHVKWRGWDVGHRFQVR